MTGAPGSERPARLRSGFTGGIGSDDEGVVAGHEGGERGGGEDGEEARAGGGVAEHVRGVARDEDSCAGAGGEIFGGRIPFRERLRG